VALRPSYELKPGDLVTIDQKWHNMLKNQVFERFIKFFQNLRDARNLPQGYPNLRAIFLPKPINTYTIDENQNLPISGLGGIQHGNMSRTYQKLFTNSTLYNPINIIKPVHLEISLDVFSFVYLYAPQKVAFPMLLDLAAIRKSF